MGGCSPKKSEPQINTKAKKYTQKSSSQPKNDSKLTIAQANNNTKIDKNVQIKQKVPEKPLLQKVQSPIDQLWISLVGTQSQMDEEIYTNFTTNILEIPQDSLLNLYLIAVPMGSPPVGHITKTHFDQLFSYARSSNVQALKLKLPDMTAKLNNPKQRKILYQKLYQCFMIGKANVDFQTAEALWLMLLTEWVYFSQFKEYLTSLKKKPPKCNKDLWDMVFDFTVSIKDIKNDYSQSDAWPIFLDQFVQFVNQKEADS